MFFFEFYESLNLAEKIHAEEWSPGIDQVLMITVQLAKALQYLHNLGIVHRDVKPANILQTDACAMQLDKNLCPHLADFGLAEYQKDLKEVCVKNWRSTGKPTGGFHKKNMVGTLIYMAPEILKKEIHTEKSDVYSFGISINELLTGVVPYTDLRAEVQAHTVLEMNYTEQQLTAAVVSSGLRPVLASPELGFPSSLLLLIQKCWDDEPRNRPSFNDIVVELNSLLELKNTAKEEDVALCKRHSCHDDQLMDDNNHLQTYKESINWSTQGENFSRRASCASESGLRIWLDYTYDPQAYYPILSLGSFATCGRRETMEDTHFLMPHMCNEKDIHAFGIFDGHRGAAAAEFSARAFPGFLQSLGSTSSPSKALWEAFVKTDDAFRNELDSFRKSKRAIKKDWHPGCTAVAALIVRNKLFVANAGDCRTVLCRAGHPLVLTKDHVATCPVERERVVSAGGQVKWQVDTWRVGPAALQEKFMRMEVVCVIELDILMGLNISRKAIVEKFPLPIEIENRHLVFLSNREVTRSIGDDDLKTAVTAEPEITEIELSAEDEFLVMASDGLWDVVNNTDVVNIIRDTVKEPGMCAKRLATEAAERGSKDNITVIVVFLRQVSTAERIY
ncbi:Protein kinase and PP2C-like domain-containing protein [Morella rubra]|uniref:Protein kinase and PP2C-like domain-containing protein n=1 Tax=Morella rubra TaxID=262757 RepID=A0A6A1WCU0_9ROSI|nr:Protein kinase and PP2C-like domain-containing protein [Morella rubra]